jgi:Outer membrane receptor for ferrienterochelin and colicins
MIVMNLSPEGRFRRAVRLSLALTVMGAVVPSLAVAQDSTASSQKKAKSEQLRGVQVTGSRIRQVDLAGATPVASITSQQITDQGYANVQELFDNLSYNVGGSLAQNQSFGFTPGASGVDLRGFGVGRTLVLLDGRRLPVYPVAAGGTQNFVDLSAIPTSAVKRVDILTTGGSAIYGSDAISGVINIITKKHYNGFSGSVRVGDTEHGGYANHREQMTYGFSDDKNHIIISGEIYHNNALWANQRFYSASDVVPGLPLIQNYSTYGASYADYVNGTITGAPNCQALLGPAGVPNLSNALYQQFGFSGNFCGFDRAQYRQLYPKVTRNSLYSRFDHDFGWATLYVQGLYSDEGTEVRFEPYPYASPLIPSNAPNAPTNGSGYFYRRMTEFGPRGDNIDNRTLYFVTGL